MTDIKEIAKNYFCESCQYQTKRKDHHLKHLLSKKHIKNTQEHKPEDEEEYKEIHFTRRRKNKTVIEVSSPIEMSTQTDCETIEISTQTDCDSCCETIESELNVELENKNMDLEEEIQELKYCLTEKNDEIHEINANYQNKLIEIENKKMYEINKVVEEKHLLSDKIQELEEENESKDNKIKEMNKIILALKQQLKQTEIMRIDEPVKIIFEPIVEPIVEPTQICLGSDERPVIKPITNVKSKKIIEIKKVIEYKPSEIELKLIKENEKLKNELEEEEKHKQNLIKQNLQNLKTKKNKSPKNYDDDCEILRADRDINNYRDTNNLLDIFKFKKLSRNHAYNKYVRYYNYMNSDGEETNVLLPANTVMLEYGRAKNVENTVYSPRGNQNEIYMDIFDKLFSSVNYRHIPIICINKRLNKFKVFDFEINQWIDANNEKKIIDYITPYIDVLYSTLFESIKNLRMNNDVNDMVIKDMFDESSKEIYLRDVVGMYIVKNTINPLADDTKYGKNDNSECDLFKIKLINYLTDKFDMNRDSFTPPEEFDEQINIETDYVVDLDNVKYHSYHGKPYVKFVSNTNCWNYD